MTIQLNVLRKLWYNKKPLRPKEIVEMTNLKPYQVYNALYQLENRRLVMIDREVDSRKHPPLIKIYARVCDKSIKKIKMLVKDGKIDKNGF